MDQWTSKSVNLLTGRDIIHLQNGTVTKKNDHQTYHEFCNIVEDLADRFGVSPECIEISLFSKGGHKKEKWRKYVIDRT